MDDDDDLLAIARSMRADMLDIAIEQGNQLLELFTAIHDRGFRLVKVGEK